MAAENYAFVSVSDESALGPFTRVLADQYHIVSLGDTATALKTAGTAIAGAGYEVLQAEEFLGDPELSDRLASLSDPAEREAELCASMEELMSQPPEVLAAAGRTAIDLAYVNPKPPTLRAAAEGAYAGFQFDAPRTDLIRAAIVGGRNVITDPAQMMDFLNLTPGAVDPTLLRISQGRGALAFLERYMSTAWHLGGTAVENLQAA